MSNSGDLGRLVADFCFCVSMVRGSSSVGLAGFKAWCSSLLLFGCRLLLACSMSMSSHISRVVCDTCECGASVAKLVADAMASWLFVADGGLVKTSTSACSFSAAILACCVVMGNVGALEGTMGGGGKVYCCSKG